MYRSLDIRAIAFCVLLVNVWGHATGNVLKFKSTGFNSCWSPVSDDTLALREPLALDQCSLTQWPDGPGQALTAQAPDTELRDIMSQIDPVRIKAITVKLVSFGTRHTLSSQTDPRRGIGAARDWIAAQMRTFAAASNGHMTITVPSYIQGPASGIPNNTRISNVIATLKGSSDPNRVYVVSGHYDSRVTDIMNGVSDAPGADDDASGVAVSMELARIMATHRPAATIILAAVAGEEQGLYGAAFLAQQLQEAGADVQGMFTNDIIGSSTADDGTVDANSIRLFAQGPPSTDTAAQAAARLSAGGENDSAARELGRFTAEVATNDATDMTGKCLLVANPCPRSGSLMKCVVRVIYREDRFLRGGDHEPFLQRGFPAARFTEPNENFAHQHQDVRVQDGMQFGDLTEFCDFDFIMRAGRVNAAAAWSLAQAPGTPKNVTIDTSVLTNNSTLNWVVGTDANLSGYEIVWRSTIDPFWTHVIPVGRTGKATVELSKDNVIFGVRAVGRNGFRSPATYPFPAG
jgi:hypothetical protein